MALIRPGPMTMAGEFFARKNGDTECIYIHPDLEPILGETYGVTLYQEQVIQIANQLAGFSMAEGDGLRKAMGKKLPEEMSKLRKRFIEGCAENRIEKTIADELFSMIEKFAGYGFNKSHSAAYAVIAAQTAYMKAHYPVEFMAAVLSVDIGSTEKVVFDVSECRRSGIEVLPPHINRSLRDFSVETTPDGGEAVRFGLGAVRNVGEGAIQAILDARTEQPDGAFASLDALCSAVDWNTVSRRVIESLAKAGALDCFGERGAVLSNLDRAITSAQSRHKAKARGQIGLFGAEEALGSGTFVSLDGPPLEQRELLAFEKEAIGLYLSSHPLANIIKGRLPDGYAEIVRLREMTVGETVRVICTVRNVRRIPTRQNKTMAAVEVEDLTGWVEAVLFPAVYEEFGTGLVPDQIIELTGRIDMRNDQIQIVAGSIATEVTPIDPEPPSRLIVLSLPQSDDYWQDVEVLQKLDSILNDQEGPDRIEFELMVSGRPIRVANRKHRVEWDDELADALRSALGTERVRVSEPIAS
jgi:DNA polymerase-3 subunit alpha